MAQAIGTPIGIYQRGRFEARRTSTGAVMVDEPADTGTTDEGVSSPRLEPSADKEARDLEFALFYRSDMAKLVGFLIVHGARPAVAADLAQDAMTDAYRQWDTIDVPRAWVRTVASRKWWRRAERDQTEFLQDELPEPSPLLSAEESAEIENRHTFLALVRTLPLSQRQVMAWTYDGYQPTEIAALLGKDPATVRSTLRDARAALQTRYRPAEETR
jgi:RNA polymerase sigma-70 factor (ECF subfamily)